MPCWLGSLLALLLLCLHLLLSPGPALPLRLPPLLAALLTGWAHSWAGRTAVQSCTAGFSSVLSCPLTSQLS